MDPVSVATATVAILAPYLAKAGEKFATAAGEAAFKKAGELYQAVSQRLAGRPAARAALEDLARDPADADNAAALRKELKKLLAEDDALLRELSAHVQAQQSAATSFHNQIAGDVGSVTQIGTAGDVHIGGKP